MTTQEKEIHERLAALTPAEQERVLGYIREMSGEPVRGEPGRNLLRFAGIWTEEEADEISRAIGHGCELNREARRAGTEAEVPGAPEGSARAFSDALAVSPPASDGKPEGVPGEALKPFFGIWTPEEGAEMWKAIEEECRRVEPDGW